MPCSSHSAHRQALQADPRNVRPSTLAPGAVKLCNGVVTPGNADGTGTGRPRHFDIVGCIPTMTVAAGEAPVSRMPRAASTDAVLKDDRPPSVSSRSSVPAFAIEQPIDAAPRFAGRYAQKMFFADQARCAIVSLACGNRISISEGSCSIRGRPTYSARQVRRASRSRPPVPRPKKPQEATSRRRRVSARAPAVSSAATERMVHRQNDATPDCRRSCRRNQNEQSHAAYLARDRRDANLAAGPPRVRSARLNCHPRACPEKPLAHKPGVC